jgi:S-(hydroxymethyl)glutathione dehydrogenase/alcohol dehydrogenase
MIAAVLRQINQPLDVCEVGLTDLQYGQVQVKMLASGICGAQLMEIRGDKGTHFPRMMGHEGVGMVESVGIGVRTVKVGDKVVCHWRRGDGIESEFPFYVVDGKAITAGKVTTFTELAIVSENRVTAVLMDTPNELAALLGCGLSTALGTIEHEAKLLMGESVLIVGCGGLGLNLIVAAKMRKASYIYVVDRSLEKQDVALDAGANQYSQSDYLLSVNRFNVIIDTTGDITALAQTIPLLAPSGRYIMVGQPRLGASVELVNALHFFDGQGKSIKATQGGCFQPEKDIPRYIDAYNAGHLDISNIITHRFPLTDINRGIDLVRDGQAGRVLITINQ